MDIDFEVGVKHTWTRERPYKVTLTRGAKGIYRWEIEVRAGTPHDVFEDVKVIENRMRETYSPIEPTEEEK